MSLGMRIGVWNPQEMKGVEQGAQGDTNPHLHTHTEVNFGNFSMLLECPLLPENGCCCRWQCSDLGSEAWPQEATKQSEDIHDVICHLGTRFSCFPRL